MHFPTSRSVPGRGASIARQAIAGILLAATLGLVDLARPDEAGADGIRGLGPRVGLTIDPDQVHVGGHLDLGDVASRLALVPNLEVGFGDDFTVVTVMAEFDYRFPSIGSAWRPYVGGGIGPVFVSHDSGADDTELGLTIQGGFARRNDTGGALFLELKLGLVDAPDAKFTLGWTFAS
jgi:hypothetical protein